MTKPPALKHQLAVIGLLCLINFFLNNKYMFPDIMEARNLVTAREMAAKSNWLIPTMNDYPRLAKPPLPTWINGLIALYVPVTNLSVHRVPSACAGVLIVLSIYFTARVFNKNTYLPFISGCIASTSYYLLLMGRQATWDIYCHAFMAAAIYFLIKPWIKHEKIYLNHSIAGVFMGLSFLSKGPVSFYAMLLPFIISWTLFIDRSIFKKYGKPLAITLGISLLMGLLWPFYMLVEIPELFLATMNSEVDAWSDRHVKPFYQYWGFLGHIGIWSILAIATFFYPYMKVRTDLKRYKFLLSWTVLTVILLSIPAEKKERYLLPVLVPLILLTAHYCYYLYKARSEQNIRKTDKFVIIANTVTMVLISIAIPVMIQIKNFSPSFIDWMIYLFLSGLFLVGLFRLNLRLLFLATLLLMTSVPLVILPRIDAFFYTNEEYKSLATLKCRPEYHYNFYAAHINPKQIYELGKSVDTLKFNDNKIIVPEENMFSILTPGEINISQFSQNVSAIRLIDSIYYDPHNSERVFYLYRIIK